MIAAVGLRDRKNFLEYSFTPAMNEGYIKMLYPDSPRHPRQKYLLTGKGLPRRLVDRIFGREKHYSVNKMLHIF